LPGLKKSKYFRIGQNVTQQAELYLDFEENQN